MRREYFSIACFLLTALGACGDREVTQNPAGPDPGPAVFVGSEACAACHADEYEQWQGSHHALAMQHASDETVLGDFDDARFEHYGVTSSFFRRDGEFWVRTDDAAGQMQEFRLPYTFGVTPLQQYLAELPGGRLQALSIAWDSRPADDGGQRWFHLYPDERIAHDDPLHWTGLNQNWNYMCAECHSTDLQKNYDLQSDSFDTYWAELTVGCEACHGPGSRHVAFAGLGPGAQSGFPVDLDDNEGAAWIVNAETGIAARSELRVRPPRQPDACGRCHSRRAQLSTEYTYGMPLTDTHLPSLLDNGLYYADGQILDEVYVWGSFMQSAMYRAGVTCTDCHEPHSARLRSSGEPSDVCAGCHLPNRFDATNHHRHPGDSVACVDCHMPARTYMVVDPRRDHSFRVPRPDLTLSVGAPNACNSCHADRDAEWADGAIRAWFGDDRAAHFASALHAGRNAAAGANTQLAAAAENSAYPAIARATALALIGPPLDRRSAEALRAGLGDPDPLVRIGALRGLAALPAEASQQWAAPLLEDPRRAVRLEAVSLLASQQDSLPAQFMPAWHRASSEYVQTQLALAERPEAAVNLGTFFAARRDVERAETSFRRALAMDPDLVPARVNLADLYRQSGRDAEGRMVLEQGLARAPDNAALQFALGLVLVRQQEQEAALGALERATTLAPDNARYAYVHGVALNSLGQVDAAIESLRSARERFPGDFDIGWALATVLRDAGRPDEAMQVAAGMQATFPENSNVAELIDSLRAR
ncbi:MAG: tetratricopeptide repeat protein [Gammaproteobacteria bacterium]|nr:tetratricopeptide repeat protein [Gammaproteobacteria bacterium]MDH4254795.1 tetratricopeptide repeat protein [Gammaproteobacteria bacterium]MDH5310791.1 tetratricopeptide repeat protein [Gammaproteobacteria bacterium]